MSADSASKLSGSDDDQTQRTQGILSANRNGPPAKYISNLTRDVLMLQGDGLELRLPPLATKFPLSQKVYDALHLDSLVACGDVEVSDYEQSATESRVNRWLAAASVAGVLLGLFAWSSGLGSRTGLGIWIAVFSYFAVMALATLLLWAIPRLAFTFRSGRSRTTAQRHEDPRIGPGSRESDDRAHIPTAGQIADSLIDSLVPSVVVLIGFGTALFITWLALAPWWILLNPETLTTFFTDPRSLSDLVTRASPLTRYDPGLFLLRSLLLGVVITFPAVMYFTFERQRGEALRTRFILDVFRLDDRFENVNDIRASYGARIRDVFGEEGEAPDGPRHRRGFRYNLPVVVATLLIAICVVVVYVELREDPSTPSGSAGLIVPYLNVASFALLGAYFFALNSAIRGYVRGDLQPKTYGQIAGRILKVVVLSALIVVLDLFWFPNEGDGVWWPGLLFAFFVGIVPNTFLTWAFELTRPFFKLDRAKLVPSQPLTDIQGVDIYDRARLEQEGVTNVEAMVHGELVDLMIQTRIPTGGLVGWVDQAVLHLYTQGIGVGAINTRQDHDSQVQKAGHRGHQASKPPDLAQMLHCAGIRTASQLVRECVTTPDGHPPSELSDDLAISSDRMGRLCEEWVDRDPGAQLEHAIRGMMNEPALRRVLTWRANRPPHCRTIDASRPLPRS